MRRRGDYAKARKRVRVKRAKQNAKRRAGTDKPNAGDPSEAPRQSHGEVTRALDVVPPSPAVNLPRAWRGGPILGPIENACVRLAKERGLALGDLLDEDVDDNLRDRLTIERHRYANTIPVPTRRRPDIPIALLTASIRRDPAHRAVRGGNVPLNTWLVPDGDSRGQTEHEPRVELSSEDDDL